MSNKFHQIAAQMPSQANAVLDIYQAHWLDASKQLAPFEFGDLKDSGTMAPGEGEYSRGMVFGVEYARYQEFGTADMPAQPFVRPAKEALRGPFKRDLRKLFGS